MSCRCLKPAYRDTDMAGRGRPPIPTDWSTWTLATRAGTTTCAGWCGGFGIDVRRDSPYEAFRHQLSLLMTGPRSEVQGDDVVLMLLDIFPSASSLTACATCPCDFQWQGLKGAQSRVWTATCRAYLIGVSLGKFSISVGQRKALSSSVKVVRCGDDFSVSGRTSLSMGFRDGLGKHMLVKTKLST